MKKKGGFGGGAVRRICLLLALCLALPITACSTGSDAPISPGLSMIEGVAVHDENVAMRTDSITVTPGMMAYFFYGYGGALIEEMNKHVAYDSNKTLHEQVYKEGLSFYDVLMNSTLQKVSEMLIYCEAAGAAGVELGEEQRLAIQNNMTALRIEAAGSNMELDAYLQRFYGPLITAADLQRVYELERLAAIYSSTVNKELEESITAERIEAYVEANGLTDGTPSRCIAYLAVPYVGGTPNETAVASAMSAMQSAPSAATLQGCSGGNYGEEQDLTPDNMGVGTLREWLFATGRAVGDYGRVETNGATYILIYTGNGMSFAEVSARMHLYDDAYATWYNGWVDALEFGYNYDILDSYDIS